MNFYSDLKNKSRRISNFIRTKKGTESNYTKTKFDTDEFSIV